MAKGCLNKTENKTRPKLPQHERKKHGDHYQQKLKSSHLIKFSKTVSYELNLALQCLHLQEVEVLLLSTLVQKWGFEFLLIIIPQAKSFHAVVFLVCFFFIFIQIPHGHAVKYYLFKV